MIVCVCFCTPLSHHGHEVNSHVCKHKCKPRAPACSVCLHGPVCISYEWRHTEGLVPGEGLCVYVLCVCVCVCVHESSKRYVLFGPCVSYVCVHLRRRPALPICGPHTHAALPVHPCSTCTLCKRHPHPGCAPMQEGRERRHVLLHRRITNGTLILPVHPCTLYTVANGTLILPVHPCRRAESAGLRLYTVASQTAPSFCLCTHAGGQRAQV